jgi:hypothetical protein
MISAFVLAMMLGLFAVAGLALDPGLALAAKVQALGQAQEAARAGAQQIDLAYYRSTGQLRLDPTQATEAAEAFLASEHATGAVTVNGNTVAVTITSAYRTQLWNLIGVQSISIQAHADAAPHSGPTTQP